eukprot:jgi/Astpho2/1263/fgenesh1_pm.00023_%23_12_t
MDLTLDEVGAGSVDVPLPVDKLAEDWLAPGDHPSPVVLVSCGSFNPPTIMHLRMFDLATQALRERGILVVGGYMSPVNDAYIKPELLPAAHRLQMCRAAASTHPRLMVDPWEAAQPEAQRSLLVLRRPGSRGGATTMLLCGADMLESFIKPGVWFPEHVEEILGKHGVVCIARDSTDAASLLKKEGSLLWQHRDRVHIVTDPVTSSISSTSVRNELAKGHSVKYLTPDAIIDYIHSNGLYRDVHHQDGLQQAQPVGAASGMLSS